MGFECRFCEVQPHEVGTHHEQGCPRRRPYDLDDVKVIPLRRATYHKWSAKCPECGEYHRDRRVSSAKKFALYCSLSDELNNNTKKIGGSE